MNRISKFFHELLNPHCEHCKVESDEDKNCKSCEIYRGENERLRGENDKLLDALLNREKKYQEAQDIDTSNLKPIMPNRMPWRVRRQMLENEDRDKALKVAELKRQSTESLENEILKEDKVS